MQDPQQYPHELQTKKAFRARLSTSALAWILLAVVEAFIVNKPNTLFPLERILKALLGDPAGKL